MLFLSDRSYNTYMEIKIIKDAILRSELCKMSKQQFGSMIKAVVDVEHKVKPQYDNRSRGVGDSKTREKIIKIVNTLVME